MTKALALKLTSHLPPNGKPPLIECAKAFLPKLRSAPPADLDTLTRKQLARSLGLGESTLYKYVGCLVREGLVSGDWSTPLSERIGVLKLSIVPPAETLSPPPKSEKPTRDTFSSIVPPSETLSEASEDTSTTVSSVDSPAETLESHGTQSTRLLAKSSIVPPAETRVTPEKCKERKEAKERNSSKKAHTATAVVGATSVTLPSGIYTAKTLGAACMTDRLTQADWAEVALMERRPTQVILWAAVVTATREAVKRQYKQLWEQAAKMGGALAKQKLDDPKHNKQWEASTQAVIAAGLGVAEYLRRAQDNAKYKYKILPLAFLGSESTLTGVVGWMTKEEKQAKRAEDEQRLSYDGFTIEELHERTRLAGI